MLWRVVKRLLISMGVLVGIYAALGFVVIPQVGRYLIPQQVAKHSDWALLIDQIRFNPFSMDLALDNVQLRDANNEQVVHANALALQLMPEWRDQRLGYQLTVQLQGEQHLALKGELVYPTREISGSLEVSALSTELPWYLARTFAAAQLPAELSLAGEGAINLSAEFALPWEQPQAVSWRLHGLAVNKEQINWQVDPEQVFAVSDISVALQGLEHTLSQPVDYALRVTLPESQPLAASGQFALQEMHGKALIDAPELSLLPLLPMAKPYWPSELSALALDSGEFFLRGEATLDLGGDTPHAAFNGDSALHHVAISDGEPLLSWDTLAAEQIQFTSHPQSLSIDTIRLDAPQGQLVIDDSGQSNLARILASAQRRAEDPDAPQLPTEPIAQPGDESGQASKKNTHVVINQLAISGGKILLQDTSVEPSLELELSELTGTLGPIRQQETAQLAMTGKLSGFADLAVHGELQTWAPLDHLAMQVELDSFDLSSLSSYVSKAAGYGVDQGQLSLALNYQVNQHQLQAENSIRLDRFELGEQGKDAEQIGLPLPMAVALLKDHKGRITLDLPLHGSLDDPSFKPARLLTSELFKLVRKAASTPFSLLAGIVNGDEELGQVAFAAGEADLSAQETAKLVALADVLKQRPGLALEVPSVFAEELDQTGDDSDQTLHELAQQRARYVRYVLIEQGGVQPEQVFVSLAPKALNSKYIQQGALQLPLVLSAG